MTVLYKRLSVLLLLVVGLSLMAGCSSTKLVDSWHASDYQAEPFKRILVLGIMQTELQRKTYEDSFVARITTGDVVGIAGYTLMPNRQDYDDKEEIEAAVKKANADAALIARFIGEEKQERYVPPTYHHTPAFGYRHGFYDYYGMSYQAMYTPGYTITDTVVKLETTVFSTDTEKMVWAGATSSFNPSSTKKVVKENADLIVADMKKAGLLEKK